MNENGLLSRQELAEAVGMKLGTFWRKVIEFNDWAKRNGKKELKPDVLQDHGNFKKFLYKPERAPEFWAAIKSLEKV